MKKDKKTTTKNPDITEHEQLGDALRQSEERFRQMVDLLPEAVCEFDISGNILFGNRAAFIMVGYDQADFEKGLNLLPMIVPEDRERAFTNIQRMLTGEALGADEYTLVRKDGSRFPATVHIANILNTSGKTVGFRGIVIDITARRQAEEALVTSEARYRSYIDVTGQIGWVTNANGEVKEDVPSLRKFSGQTYEEAKGSGWTKALHPDDLERTLQVWNKAVATKSTYEIEYRMRRYDGVYRDFLARGFPVFREDGSIREWVGTCIDITERRQAEDALQESEDRIHLLLDSAAEAIYGIDMNGNCTFCNSACLRMLGYKRTDELLGRNMHWQIHSKRPDGTPFPIEECRIFQAFRNGKGTHVDDEVLWRSDGTSFAVEYWSYPLISNGIVAGAVVTFLDITERKRVEETLVFKNVILSTQQETSLDGILVVDENGIIVSYNRRFVDMWGIPPDVVESKSDERALQSVMDKLTNPEEFIGKVQHLYESRQETSRDEIDLKDGRVFDRYSAPMLGAGGKYFGRVWYFSDITERKRAEEALKRSTQLLRDTGAMAKVGGWELDVVTQEQVWTEEVYRIHEVDVTYKPTVSGGIDFYAPTSRPIIERAVQCAIEHGEPFDVELEIITAKGNLRSVRAIGRRDQEHGKVLGTFQDITERKFAEEALRQFVDRLSLATRAGGVGIWDYDVINNKLIWDDQMYHLYGITQEKFGGAYEAWRTGLHPEDMQRGDNEIQMALRGEKEFDTEFRVLWPDGTIRNIRALAILQRDASGKPLRMIGTNWDITERKQAEAELEKTIQELQSAIEQIKTLKGLVPICAWCKKIRNDKGYWEQVEAYVSRYTEAQFSHGICPECAKKAYPEFSKDEKTASK